MRIGTMGYRTRTGLGYQVKSYVEHLGIERVLVVDLSMHNGLPLTNWYGGQMTVQGYPDAVQFDAFLQGLDVVIVAETPLNYQLYELARRKGVKTVCVPNWEFFDHLVNPHYPLPDMFIAPSRWHYRELQGFCAQHRVGLRQLHHPVDTTQFHGRLRQSTKTFHIAGKPAAHDRNGTWDYLYSTPNGTVITQDRSFAHHLRSKFRHSNVHTDINNPAHMYQLGDIMVLPRKYGGNCLPLNEALASGCPVIMPDIEPNNHLLPSEWLVKASVVDSFTPRTKIDIYQTDRVDLQRVIEHVQGDITRHSQTALDIAQTISWASLKPRYLEALESLL